jgi:hypothetical protein
LAAAAAAAARDTRRAAWRKRRVPPRPALAALQAAADTVRDAVAPCLTDKAARASLQPDGLDRQPLGFETGGARAGGGEWARRIPGAATSQRGGGPQRGARRPHSQRQHRLHPLRASRPSKPAPPPTPHADGAVDAAARVLRMLYIRDLRGLQSAVDEAIVAVQELTADPKTDSALGKVGH